MLTCAYWTENRNKSPSRIRTFQNDHDLHVMRNSRFTGYLIRTSNDILNDMYNNLSFYELDETI
ncbi:hypothetical protein EON65_17050 [archaeon]|nr:MAG: hypothetical protein EON65_17050 [archaeon]